MAASCVHSTLRLLRPRGWASSPATGIALQHSPSNTLALAQFLSQQQGDGSTLAPELELSAVLFHAAEEGAPLRPTLNRSLPASWLDPELLGRTLALSAEDDEASARAGLEALGIRSNHVGDVRSGVSLARFEGLLPLMQPSMVARCAGLKAAAEGAGDSAVARAALLGYMHGADLLDTEAAGPLLTDSGAREAWLHEPVPHISEEAAHDAATRLLLRSTTAPEPAR